MGIWRIEKLTVISFCHVEVVALSQQSIHSEDYHGEQQFDDSRGQFQLPTANDRLDKLQPTPPLTNEVLLNQVELGEPFFTEEELTLAMTRTTITPWVEERTVT